jgi:hypothetical protein
MIDASDRIARINEVLAALNEQPEVPPSLPPGPKLTDEEKAKQAAEKAARLKAAQDAADAKQQDKFQKERDDVEAARQFNPNATRFYPDVTMKGKERREALRGYMDYLRMDPERLRLFKQQKAYASAEMVGQAQRARTAYDRSAADTAARVSAYNRGAALSRAGSIGRHSPGLVEPLVGAAEASYEADVASQNLADVVKRQKSESEIRRQARAERDATEADVRKSNPYGYGEAPITTPSDYIKNLPGMYKSKRQPKPASPQSTTASTAPAQSQGKFEFFDRKTGQVGRSDAPGVDRVFRDPSGKAYRIEGGSGRKVFI